MIGNVICNKYLLLLFDDQTSTSFLQLMTNKCPLRRQKMENDKVISVLNDLVETCKDGQKGFQEAAKSVNNLELKSFFNDVSQDRARMAVALQAQVVRFGGEPDESGSVSGALHRAWMDLKNSVNVSDQSILESVETGEDTAVKAFDEALKEPLPLELNNLILQYRVNVKDVHDRVRQLRDSGQYKTKSA
jgi:uncharacterized protein (TIGR02284 family)